MDVFLTRLGEKDPIPGRPYGEAAVIPGLLGTKLPGCLGVVVTVPGMVVLG